jgi:hypothetical protein
MPISSKDITIAAVAFAGAAGLFYLHARTRDESAEVPTALRKSPYSKELKLAIRLAKRAGDNMKGYIESKGTSDATDFCTKVDVENESLIMDGIQKVFPSHELIGEETTGTGEVPKLTKTPTWIIDPIDGTTK